MGSIPKSIAGWWARPPHRTARPGPQIPRGGPTGQRGKREGSSPSSSQRGHAVAGLPPSRAKVLPFRLTTVEIQIQDQEEAKSKSKSKSPTTPLHSTLLHKFDLIQSRPAGRRRLVLFRPPSASSSYSTQHYSRQEEDDEEAPEAASSPRVVLRRSSCRRRRPGTSLPPPARRFCDPSHPTRVFFSRCDVASQMSLKEQRVQVDGATEEDTAAAGSPTSHNHHKPGIPRVSNCSSDKDSGLSLCRVCHCVEADLRGKSALGLLGIVPPPPPTSDAELTDDAAAKTSTSKDSINAPRFVELISPDGEIFVCAADVESAPLHQQDHLVDLGCSCKNELALAHYACALKWFISHGSTVCEICGNVAVNVRPSDFNKVLASLKDYEALMERTSAGQLPCLQYGADTGVDPIAVAAIRRQRLYEISSWFNPHSSHVAVSQGHIEQPPVSPTNNSVEHAVVAAGAVHARWRLENTGVFVAIGIGVIILAWFVAPHLGKKTAVIGLHLLLGGLCALTIIISLRFVFPRIQYGSMQYWAILFVSWFLVFGVWASRTRSIRTS
ncbi:hypothetical protein ACP4OV_025955 [Aristida adscensionis]